MTIQATVVRGRLEGVMEATHGDSCGARSQIPAEEHPHTYALAPPGYSRRTVDELGALMRDGDEHAERAWAELYAALKTDLRWYAYRLTGNEAEADDLVQDTLVRAWEKRGDYDQACPYRPWIFTILKNLGRSGQRKDAGHIRRLDRTSPVEVLERCHGSMEADPAARTIEMGARDRLAPIIDRLREPDRHLLVAWSEGVRTVDYARERGLNPSTVRARLHRARIHLATLYERTYGSIP